MDPQVANLTAFVDRIERLIESKLRQQLLVELPLEIRDRYVEKCKDELINFMLKASE